MGESKADLENILKDTSFDRAIVPKDSTGDLLVSLLKKKAYNEKSGVLLSKYPIKAEQLDILIKQNRVKLISHSPVKIFLTDIGKIVAAGEFSLRNREK